MRGPALSRIRPSTTRRCRSGGATRIRPGFEELETTNEELQSTNEELEL